MSKLDGSPTLDVPTPRFSHSLPLTLSHSLSTLSKPNHLLFSPSFSFSFTTSYSVPSPNPYMSQRLGATFTGQLKGRQHPRRKMTFFFFFTLRSLSRWLLQSVTESFWQELLGMAKRAYGVEASGTCLGRQLQSKGNSGWSRMYVLF